jgi:hypothetical protein
MSEPETRAEWDSDDAAIAAALGIAAEGIKAHPPPPEKRQRELSSDSSGNSSDDEYPCQVPESPPKRTPHRRRKPEDDAAVGFELPCAPAAPGATTTTPTAPADPSPSKKKGRPPKGTAPSGKPRRRRAPPTATATAAPTTAATEAMEAQQDFSTWMELVTKATENVASEDCAATASFVAHARALPNPGSLIECLTAAAIGTLSPPGGGGTPEVAAIRRFAARTMGTFLPPLVGERLAALLGSAVRRRCFGCSAELDGSDPDSSGLLLCDECVPTELVDAAGLDGWMRLYVPTIVLPPQIRGLEAKTMCLRCHVGDAEAEIAKRGGSLAACLRATASDPSAEEIGAVAAMEHRKCVRGEATRYADRLPPAAAAAASANSVRSVLTPLAPRLGDWAVDALDAMCRTLGSGYRIVVINLVGRHEASLATAKAAECKIAFNQMGKRGQKRPSPPAVAMPTNVESNKCVARLLSMARRWRLVEAEMEDRCPSVQGYLAARTWQFTTKPQTKAASQVMRDWLLGVGFPGEAGDAQMPQLFIDALSRYARIADQALLLDSSSAVRRTAVLAPLFNVDLALRMTNLREPLSVKDLLESVDMPD